MYVILQETHLKINTPQAQNGIARKIAKEFRNILSSDRNNLNVEWRRNKVLELSSHGHTQSDIATVLHVT
jgi:hypothetical protein